MGGIWLEILTWFYGKHNYQQEIVKLYVLFIICPPDRHSHDTVEVQKEEEKKFKDIGEAYAVLSDQKKRTRYDNGHDLEDLDGGGFGTYF